MIQETIRRLSNTCQRTTQKRRNQIVEEYIDDLRRSGYEEETIRKNITAPIVGYVRRVKREKSGGLPVHRSGDQIRRGT